MKSNRIFALTAFVLSAVILAVGAAKLPERIDLVCLSAVFVNFLVFSLIPLVRKRDGRRVELIKGRPVSQPEYRVRFGSLADKRVMAELGIDEQFSFDSVPYKVIDIGRDGVKIQDTWNADAGSVLVPVITSAAGVPATSIV